MKKISRSGFLKLAAAAAMSGDCGCIDCLREFGKFLFGCRFERCCLYAGHLYRQGYRYG